MLPSGAMTYYGAYPVYVFEFDVRVAVQIDAEGKIICVEDAGTAPEEKLEKNPLLGKKRQENGKQFMIICLFQNAGAAER